MATPGDLEVLQSMVLEEQQAAAVDRRPIDRELLNYLGDVTITNAPIFFESPSVSYLNPSGKVLSLDSELFDFAPGGRFGGITARTVLTDDGEPVEKAFYLAEDTSLHGVGYVCPAETTKVVDVKEALCLDEKFLSMALLLCEDVDLASLGKIATLFRQSDPTESSLFISFLNAANTPDMLIDAAHVTRWLNFRDGSSPPIAVTALSGARHNIKSGSSFGRVWYEDEHRQELSVNWGTSELTLFQVVDIIGIERVV